MKTAIQGCQSKIHHSCSYQSAKFFYKIQQAVDSCAAVSHTRANCPHGDICSGSCEVTSARWLKLVRNGNSESYRINMLVRLSVTVFFLPQFPAQVLHCACKSYESHSFFDIRAGSKNQESQRIFMILSQSMYKPYFRMQMRTHQG